MTAESDKEALLATTVVIKQGKEEFEFAIPSIATSIKLGMRARTIRRFYDTSGQGDDFGLDAETSLLAWGAAAFETLLKKADTADNWPFSKNDAGIPLVDHTKFPDDKLDVMLEVSWKLREELTRFRTARLAEPKSDSAEAVAGS